MKHISESVLAAAGTDNGSSITAATIMPVAHPIAAPSRAPAQAPAARQASSNNLAPK